MVLIFCEKCFSTFSINGGIKKYCDCKETSAVLIKKKLKPKGYERKLELTGFGVPMCFSGVKLRRLLNQIKVDGNGKWLSIKLFGSNDDFINKIENNDFQ